MAKFKEIETSKMDLKEAYRAMQAACGIEVGDTVRILRTAKSGELGWDNSWSHTMDAFVGREGVVAEIHHKGIQVTPLTVALAPYVSSPSYPFFVLEVVAKKKPESVDVSLNANYEAKVFKDSIVVGCQRFSITVIDDLVAARKSLN